MIKTQPFAIFFGTDASNTHLYHVNPLSSSYLASKLFEVVRYVAKNEADGSSTDWGTGRNNMVYFAEKRLWGSAIVHNTLFRDMPLNGWWPAPKKLGDTVPKRWKIRKSKS
jgi:hypothetical protein